jgi:hypothetical protein
MKTKFILYFILLSLNSILAQTSYFEKFPFKETISIKLVSYSNMESTLPNWKWQSCITMPQLKGGNVLDIDLTKMDKIKVLNLKEAAKLYEIATAEMTCPEYESPTNCCDVKRGYGILFLNQLNEIYAVIDFCFECNYWSRYPAVSFEPICPQKLKSVSEFFVENGFE